MFSSVFSMYNPLVINMFYITQKATTSGFGATWAIAICNLCSHKPRVPTPHVLHTLFAILHTSLALVVETPHELRNSPLLVHKTCTQSKKFPSKTDICVIYIEKIFCSVTSVSEN